MSEMPWIASYPAGVRWDISIEPKPVDSILSEAAARWTDQPALNFMGRRTSYRELDDLVSRFACGLQRLGVRPGVHVGLFLPNTPHYLIAFLGVLRAGGVVVNYSPLDAVQVLEHKIADSQTDFLVTLDLDELYPRMVPMLAKTRLKKLIVGNVAEMTADPAAVGEQMRAAGTTVPVPQDDQHVPFATLLESSASYKAWPVEDPAEAIAVLQYTGGTTGLPKGAMLTHQNLVAACEQVVAVLTGTPPIVELGTERMLAVLPPFHIYALTANLLLGVRLGSETYQHLRFDPLAALQAISEHRLTLFNAVPTMLTALLSNPAIGDYDLRSLKYCNSGGAPLPLEVAESFEQATGTWVAEGWGMTETSPTGTFTPLHGKHKPGSCGLPMPAVTLRILDMDNPTRYLPPGEKGELCIKGPNVMKGYWNKPEATAESTSFDGMFRTGDVACMDDEGFVFIVDRTKDMLLCSGYNVYPRVLEEAIYQYPGIHEVAVIGVPDKYRGQSPKAFVTLLPDTPEFSLGELQEFLADKLGRHEMIRALEIRKELPKTPVGKLSKKALQDEEAAKTAQSAA